MSKRICAWCGRPMGETEEELQGTDAGNDSHSICPRCDADMGAQVDAVNEINKREKEKRANFPRGTITGRARLAKSNIEELDVTTEQALERLRRHGGRAKPRDFTQQEFTALVAALRDGRVQQLEDKSIVLVDAQQRERALRTKMFRLGYSQADIEEEVARQIIHDLL